MIKIAHADFTTATIPDEWLESVDIIVTDPPYAKEYLWLYGSLAAFANQVLKDKGSLVTIIPHRYAIEAIQEMEIFLKYRWLMAMYFSNPPWASLNLLGIQVRWKPLVWMVKHSLPRQKGYRPDAYEHTSHEKEFHTWQQAEEWAEFCLKFMPPDGKLVCDPMMGTGTVGVVCKKLGYDFIGIDNDPKMIEIAKERIIETKVSDNPSLSI